MDAIIADVIGDIALVIAVSSLFGGIVRRCGIPAVVGQIIAGILLGPTLLGRLPGHLSSHLFPTTVLPYLDVIAQVAVVIFMFSVGYEIEFGLARGRRRVVPLLMTAALGVPMGLGILCVLTFRGTFAAIGMRHDTRSLVLFMGVAVSITALPVLAAIVRERGLAGTAAGVIATTAAGGMDALAWIVLAIAVIGTGHSSRLPWLATLAVMAGFTAVMTTVVPRVLSWWAGRSSSILSDPVPAALALAMGCAWFTSYLGLHPVFGGFIAGLAMRASSRKPDASLLRTMDQTGKVLLPLYFVITGFSVDISSLRSAAILLLAVVLVIAIAGKVGPSYAVARLVGLDPRDSALIAALINTRGLTELIALNVALADGIINRRLFTVLVVMAVITTLMTGPLLSLAQRKFKGQASLRLTAHQEVSGQETSADGQVADGYRAYDDPGETPATRAV
jgi:Kef-type K+ transport system membrane component KefB